MWPGRRWKGKKGTAQAIHECEAVQLDPLNIFARSQDIVLHSRVLDYKPEYLYHAAYQDRQFFDYGGWLAMCPMPILYGDDLVARLEPKLDRSTMTLEIKGFWHEEDAPVKDIDFATALGRGLVRFANF